MPKLKVEFELSVNAVDHIDAVNQFIQYILLSAGVACIVKGEGIPADGVVVVGKVGYDARLAEDFMQDPTEWKPWDE